jgi:hypothetical protein
VNVSTRALPFGPLLVGSNLKPIIIFFLIVLHIGDQSFVLLLHSFDPLFAVLGPSMYGHEWYLLQNFLHFSFHVSMLKFIRCNTSHNNFGAAHVCFWHVAAPNINLLDVSAVAQRILNQLGSQLWLILDPLHFESPEGW